MTKWRDLPTNDKVLLFVTFLVGFLAVAMVLGVFLAIFIDGIDRNIAPIVELLSNAFLMLTGAVVGYIGGRGSKGEG